MMHFGKQGMRRSAQKLLLMLFLFLAFLTHSYQVSTTSFATRQPLPTGTILLHKGSELWTLDPSSLSLDEYLPLGFQPDSQLISITISPQGKYVFLMEWESNAPGSVVQLTQIDSASGHRTVLFNQPNLIGMTEVSPENKRAILIYADDSTKEPAIWRFCLLDIETANCPDIDLPYIDRNNFFWIDDLSFVTISSDSVDLYMLSEIGIAEKRTLQQNDWRFVSSDLIPGTQDLLIAAYQRSSPAEPVFIVGDLYDLKFSILPYGIASYYKAVFNDIMVSPGNQFMLYKRAEHLSVVNFRQGILVFELDNIRQVAWGEGGNRLIVISKSFDTPFQLISIDPLTGEPLEQLSFDEAIELYIVR